MAIFEKTIQNKKFDQLLWKLENEIPASSWSAELEAGSDFKEGCELVVTLAGCGMNLVCGVLTAWFSLHYVWVEGFVFAGAHILLCAFNLLPIPPLDGSHALNLAVSALFGPLVGDAVAALAGVLCSLALLGGVVYLYVQTRGGALVIFAALALLLSALKELRLARRAIKV